ncbi:hypothetical protein ACG3RN_27875 [Pseudomonas aeruginosa]
MIYRILIFYIGALAVLLCCIHGTSWWRPSTLPATTTAAARSCRSSR